MSTTKRTRLYDGETFEHRGAIFKVTFPYDEAMQAPWIEHDGHGIVSEWTTREKAPGERVLVRDRHSYRYYDVQASLKKARKEGWDAPPYGEGTKRQQAVRAVERDYEYLRGWCNDEWHYCGVVVKRLDRPGDDALWGIEDNADEYLVEVAYELADEILGTEAAGPAGDCG